LKKIVIIPARFNSSRLPGKPLLDIHGMPMVVRVCEAVNRNDFDDVVVATDDQRVFDVVIQYGYHAIMTRPDHVSGTDRLHEAAHALGLEADDIIINLQGDEPLMPSENLLQVAGLLTRHKNASVATLYEHVEVEEGKSNPNIVKLVQASNNEVLYFSRSAIPYERDEQLGSGDTLKRHVGIYAYRKSALDDFVSYEEGTLERLEKLEQLRFMENGNRIVAQKSKLPIPIGVDTQADLDAVRSIYSGTMK